MTDAAENLGILDIADRGVTFPRGFRAGGARCGLKTEGDDLAVIVCDATDCGSAAGVFTTNRVQASCVTWSRRVAQSGAARGIVCNAGNANACNGDQGLRDTERMAELTAAGLGWDTSGRAPAVLVASTGVIGHPMPMGRLEAGIPAACASLGEGPEADARVARAIMTTDTRPKQAAVEIAMPCGVVRVGGVCKGSGMIAPNMATMLCFVTTDARVPAPVLQSALTAAVERTFNRTTVDGDTSTNDMVLLLASGASGVGVDAGDDTLAAFSSALEAVCRRLAREVARDGEGATKLVEVTVQGAQEEAGAARIARTIAESPLVKTALFGSDPNWGRILMAAGRAGVAFDPARVEVRLGDIVVCHDGRSVPFDADAAHAYLTRSEVCVDVDLHLGSASATFYTCDYSYDYVRINAEYHT